jgi:DDE superfamily endonuclease
VGRRGVTPVVKVTGGHNSRVSLAALICLKPGCRPRLIYRVHRRARGGDRRKGFTEMDYAALLDAAHQQLGGPLVVVSDNLNTHVSAAMTELIAARDWLTVYQLPPYAHELNPAGLVWSHLKRSLAKPGQTRHQPADRPGKDKAQTDAVPARPPRRVPGQHPPGPHNPSVTPTLKDR